jgi:hypothetical protein
LDHLDHFSVNLTLPLFAFPLLSLVRMQHAAAQPSVRVIRLAAPLLNDVNLGCQRVCIRPMGSEGPVWRLRVDPATSQLVLEFHSLGPAGWTLAPGGARHIVALLNAHQPAPAWDTPIAVIGHGVAGLFLARELRAAGWARVSVFYRQSEQLTSHHAGGFLAPPAIPHANAEARAEFIAVAVDSYRQWFAIAQARVDAVVRSARICCSFVHRYPLEEDQHGLRLYVDAGLMSHHDVDLDFGTGAPLRPVGAHTDTQDCQQSAHTGS